MPRKLTAVCLVLLSACIHPPSKDDFFDSSVVLDGDLKSAIETIHAYHEDDYQYGPYAEKYFEAISLATRKNPVGFDEYLINLLEWNLYKSYGCRGSFQQFGICLFSEGGVCTAEGFDLKYIKPVNEYIIESLILINSARTKAYLSKLDKRRIYLCVDNPDIRDRLRKFED